MSRSNRIALFLVAAAGLLLLYGRIPSYTNAFCDPDLAGIAYGAGDLLAGGTIYPHCVETKPPGVYLILAACFSLFGLQLTPVYVLAALLHLLVLLAVARMAQRAAGPAAGAAAAWLYALLAMDADAAANCPNYETWMTFFGVFGLFWLSPGRESVGSGGLFLSGLFLGLSLLMKQQALLFAVVAAFWVLTLRRNIKRSAGHSLALYLLGFALPLALVGAMWAWKGGVETMLADLNPRRLGGYVGAAGAASDFLINLMLRAQEQWSSAWPAWLAVLGGGAVFALRPDSRHAYLNFLFYLLVALIAVIAGSRFFRHYLIMLAAPLALTGAYVFGRWEELLAPRWWRLTLYPAALAAALWAMKPDLAQATLMLQAWQEGKPMVNEEIALALTFEDNNLQVRYQDESYRALGRYIAAHSAAGEGLYVFPYHPQIYFWAQRRAPTKHYMYFDVMAGMPYLGGGWHATVNETVRQNRRRLLAELAARPPRFIVLPAEGCGAFCAFAELEEWVKAHYRFDVQAPIVEYSVYRLK